MKGQMLRLIMQGKIKGRRNVGKRRISWLRNLRDWYNCSSIELFRAAANKVKIAMMVSNLRWGMARKEEEENLESKTSLRFPKAVYLSWILMEISAL